MNAESCFWTVDDVSRYLKISNDTIYRWIEKKGMPAIRIGKKWLFKKSEIDAWLENSAERGVKSC